MLINVSLLWLLINYRLKFELGCISYRFFFVLFFSKGVAIFLQKGNFEKICFQKQWMLWHIKNVEKMHAALSVLNVFNDDFFRRMFQNYFSVKLPKMCFFGLQNLNWLSISTGLNND